MTKKIIKFKMPSIIIDMNATDGGDECSFYKLGNKGYKIYPSLKDARFAYKKQKWATKYNIAPKIYGEMFSAFDKDKYHIGFGYQTEIARPVNYNCFFDTLEDVQRIKKINDRKNLEKMLKLGFVDLHPNNLGYIDNNLVVIDFGPATFGVEI